MTEAGISQEQARHTAGTARARGASTNAPACISDFVPNTLTMSTATAHPSPPASPQRSGTGSGAQSASWERETRQGQSNGAYATSGRELSPGYPSPPISPQHQAQAGAVKGAMGAPAVPSGRAGAADVSGYASIGGASHAMQQQSHPPSRAATGGQSHAHRPVSAMPVSARSNASSTTGVVGNDAAAVMASMNAGQSNYNDRRATAQPTMTSSQTAGPGSGFSVPPLPSSATGLDSTTSQAISSGIPVTSPAALSYFAAHPRRQQVHFGAYLLLQTLGEGEFGKVKLGVHKEWGEEVAVKLIKRDKIGSPDGQLNINGPKDPAKMSKVEREIQVLKDVRHPNIVRLYEVIESDRYIGIVLEYASGGELFDHILAHKYLKERDACRLFAQLISGVSYLHKKKIVHRDLKLENLLLDRNRNVIITDFGFANNFEDRRDDLMATSCGSPCYAAPELVVQDGLYAGSAVDVWSCGVILYAMLAGYLPFDDDPNNPDGDNINLLYKYIMATPLSFPEYISAEPRDLLSKMLVPDPRRRADLQGVMAHSWLAPYRDLFRFSVDELERAAVEQQTKKRQVYRQQMQVQQQLQDQQRSGRGPASRAGGSSGKAAPDPRQSRHQSAMPTTTASRTESALYDNSGAHASRSRPTTGMPSQPADLPAVSAPPTPAYSTPQALAQLGPEELNRMPNEPRKREAPPESSGHQKTPSSQKPQRHTIQLEYDGDNRRAAQRNDSAQNAPPVPRVDKKGSAPRIGVDGASAPVTSQEAAVIPAVPALVPAAERQASMSKGSTHTSPARDVSGAQNGASSATPEDHSILPTTNTSEFSVPAPSPRKSAGGRPSTNSGRVPSNPLPAGNPPSTNAGSRIVSGGAQPEKTDADSLAKIQVSPERRSSRHRKGMSTDKFSFARLLGSNVAAEANPAAETSEKAPVDSNDSNGATPVTPTRDSAADRKGSSSSGRRKAMSLVVGRLGDQSSPATRDREKAQQAAKVAKEERRLTGRARKENASQLDTPKRAGPASSTASQQASPATNASIRSARTPSKQPAGRSANGSNRAQGALFDESVNESSSTVGPSSSAAKKVMDWFRKKSLSRGTFNEQPPFGPFDRDPSASEVSIEASLGRKQASGSQATEAPRVVVTGATGANFAAGASAQPMESVPSSRSTSGTHSQASHATENTTLTSLSASSNAAPGVKSSGASTVQAGRPGATDSPNAPTPRASSRGGALSPASPQDGGFAVPAAPITPRSRAAQEVSLRFHQGAVDQSALTSRPPLEVFAEVQKVLQGMGIEVNKERDEDYKLECVRRKKPKTLIGAAQNLGLGLRSSVFPPTQADYERSARPPLSPSGSIAGQSPASGPAGSIRSFLRRGSQQQSVTLASVANGEGSTSSDAAGASTAGPPQPLYGEASVDGGQEVRFSVEVTQIKNLAGLYSLDIRRMKGNLWAYKFLYHALLERCELGGGSAAQSPRTFAAGDAISGVPA
ncbi:Pkinase-domain-containing protein [Ceraceosorus guamensis]|uniref:non-specific serine/threonine protein kinase n=1 Tax=Ceraceosorus guamensis TaxID=1522189 RepID=A0A316W7I9_9BASI|nr:Pkinase-domain-containing protein [Ceraceosorus guamensis]PWN45792.1 Pkinase-domain-containing protein [Ceraceosorus guamensis]